MGPGMTVKALMPRHFSIVVFGLTQIAIDIEVLWHIATWTPPLHRFCHTYLGATVIAIFFTVFGKPASQHIKVIWNAIAKRCPKNDMSVTVHTSWLAATSASFIGSYSHILLDSLFHGSMEPMKPWSYTNPLGHTISPVSLELICVILGIIGLTWFFLQEIRKRKKANNEMLVPSEM